MCPFGRGGEHRVIERARDDGGQHAFVPRQMFGKKRARIGVVGIEHDEIGDIAGQGIGQRGMGGQQAPGLFGGQGKADLRLVEILVHLRADGAGHAAHHQREQRAEQEQQEGLGKDHRDEIAAGDDGGGAQLFGDHRMASSACAAFSARRGRPPRPRWPRRHRAGRAARWRARECPLRPRSARAAAARRRFRAG
jgi:hypothetical protein